MYLHLKGVALPFPPPLQLPATSYLLFWSWGITALLFKLIFSLLKLENSSPLSVIQPDSDPNLFDRLFFSQGSMATSVKPEECSAKLAQPLALVVFNLFF